MACDAVAFAAGGTGGHVAPALAVAEEIRRLSPGTALLLMGGARHGERIFDFPGEMVDVQPVRITPKALLTEFPSLRRSVRRAGDVLRTRKVGAVVGTGGYASFPTLLAALFQGIPVWLLEQNQIPGRVVRLLKPFVKRVVGPAGCRLRGIEPWGSPARSEFFNLTRPPSPPPIRILVSGGSQGSKTLDERLPPLLSKCQDVHVIHLCRPGGSVAPYTVPHEIHPTGPGFPARLASVHVLVGRAGGSTIAECNAAARAQILIPLPSAMDDHQRANARIQKEGGAAEILDEGEGDDAWLSTLSNFLKPERIRLASEAAGRLADRGLTERLARELLAKAATR
ncbi:MAG: glycosyltransferase [Planctomycetota bacterium]